jgi:hypothetical protein
VDIERALDELYGAAPEEFVAERSRLVKELKAEGRKVEAERFAALRKPPLAAWVLNRLVRDEKRDVDLLLHSGHRMRAAQERDAFDQARGVEREAIDRLTRAAGDLLRERGSVSDAVLKQVADSLRAAAVSDEGRELLVSGRFTHPLSGEGFDVLSGLALKKAPAPRPARQAADDRLRKAKAELAEAKNRLRYAEREAQAARRAAARAEARLEAARSEVEVAEGKLEGLRG